MSPRIFLPGMALSSGLLGAWSITSPTLSLSACAGALALTTAFLWVWGAVWDRLEVRWRPSPFPDFPCTCGCPGPQHRTVWEDGIFKGTTCPVEQHGRHKYAMDLVAGRGPRAI